MKIKHFGKYYNLSINEFAMVCNSEIIESMEDSGALTNLFLRCLFLRKGKEKQLTKFYINFDTYKGISTDTIIPNTIVNELTELIEKLPKDNKRILYKDLEEVSNLTKGWFLGVWESVFCKYLNEIIKKHYIRTTDMWETPKELVRDLGWVKTKEGLDKNAADYFNENKWSAEEIFNQVLIYDCFEFLESIFTKMQPEEIQPI